MENYIITTDSSCDLKLSELEEKNIPVIYFRYTDGENVYVNDMNEGKFKEFYEMMRKGKNFKTSQINEIEYYNFFKEQLNKNQNIIHISLTEGLSNTINNARSAAEKLMSENVNANIKIIDTKIACLGLALIVEKAISYKNLSIDEAYDRLLGDVNHLNTYYTTDTLKYFARGGRLSKVEAFIGGALRINPILDCHKDGKLRVTAKVRGEKHALDYIVSKTKENVINPSEQTLYICHADNIEKAKEVEERMRKEVGFKDYKTYFMGPTIGAHAGPGLVAVFYFGKPRSN